MIEYKRNGQNVKERGTVATEWTTSQIIKNPYLALYQEGFKHYETLEKNQSKLVNELKNDKGESVIITHTADNISIKL